MQLDQAVEASPQLQGQEHFYKVSKKNFELGNSLIYISNIGLPKFWGRRGRDGVAAWCGGTPPGAGVCSKPLPRRLKLRFMACAEPSSDAGIVNDKVPAETSDSDINERSHRQGINYCTDRFIP